MNEKELIFSLQKGDPGAFRHVVNTWQHMVYNTVLSIVQDIQEAEDIAQEVFMQIFQSIGSFRGDAKLSTWIYRIAVSRSLDAVRKRKSKKMLANLKSKFGLSDKEESAIHFCHPGVQAEDKERSELLFRAMKKLPENQRIAFVLIKLEGLGYAETAEIMKLTIKSVEALMHRAKENLRKELTSYYYGK